MSEKLLLVDKKMHPVTFTLNKGYFLHNLKKHKHHSHPETDEFTSLRLKTTGLSLKGLILTNENETMLC